MTDWPSSEINAVMRLRALAAALPHVVLLERVIDAPYRRVWSIAGDLDVGIPEMEGGIQRIDLVHRQGSEFHLVAHTPRGRTRHSEGLVGPGWCVMRSRFMDAGMAAAPFGGPDRTLIAHYEGSRLFGRLGRPYFAHKVAGDLRRLVELVMTPSVAPEGRSDRTLAQF